MDRNIPKPNMPKMMKSLLLFSLHLCLQLTTSATASVVLGGQNQSIQERLRTTDWAAKKQLEEKIEQSNIFSSTEAEEIIEQSNLFSSPKAEQSAAATFSATKETVVEEKTKTAQGAGEHAGTTSTEDETGDPVVEAKTSARPRPGIRRRSDTLIFVSESGGGATDEEEERSVPELNELVNKITQRGAGHVIPVQVTLKQGKGTTSPPSSGPTPPNTPPSPTFPPQEEVEASGSSSSNSGTIRSSAVAPPPTEARTRSSVSSSSVAPALTESVSGGATEDSSVAPPLTDAETEELIVPELFGYLRPSLCHLKIDPEMLDHMMVKEQIDPETLDHMMVTEQEILDRATLSARQDAERAGDSFRRRLDMMLKEHIMMRREQILDRSRQEDGHVVQMERPESAAAAASSAEEAADSGGNGGTSTPGGEKPPRRDSFRRRLNTMAWIPDPAQPEGVDVVRSRSEEKQAVSRGGVLPYECLGKGNKLFLAESYSQERRSCSAAHLVHEENVRGTASSSSSRRDIVHEESLRRGTASSSSPPTEEAPRPRRPLRKQNSIIFVNEAVPPTDVEETPIPEGTTTYTRPAPTPEEATATTYTRPDTPRPMIPQLGMEPFPFPFSVAEEPSPSPTTNEGPAKSPSPTTNEGSAPNEAREQAPSPSTPLENGAKTTNGSDPRESLRRDDHRPLLTEAENLFVGIAGGTAEVTALMPLLTAKFCVQEGRALPRSLGGLYRGWAVQAGNVAPITAVQMLLNGLIEKRVFDANHKPLSDFEKALSAGLAGGLSAVIYAPVDLVCIHQQKLNKNPFETVQYLARYSCIKFFRASTRKYLYNVVLYHAITISYLSELQSPVTGTICLPTRYSSHLRTTHSCAETIFTNIVYRKISLRVTVRIFTRQRLAHILAPPIHSRNHGSRSLFRGFSAMAGREALYTSGYLALAPFLAKKLGEWDSSRRSVGEQREQEPHSLRNAILGSMGAGAIAVGLTLPLDLAKTVYQADIEEKKYKSSFEAMRKLHAEGGMKVFTRGALPRFTRVCGAFFIVSSLREAAILRKAETGSVLGFGGL